MRTMWRGRVVANTNRGHTPTGDPEESRKRTKLTIRKTPGAQSQAHTTQAGPANADFWYKMKNELNGFYPPISFSIPEIENIYDAIKQFCSIRNLKK